MGIEINKKFLPMKAHYFLFNAGTAPIVPYMPVYARQLGFSSVIVGTIYLILPIIGLLAKPIFGAISDRFQRHKTLFILFQLLTAITFLCIKFIPPIHHVATVDFNCNDGLQDLHYCPSAGNQIDECLLEELTTNNEQNKPNFMTCNFICQVTNNSMWDVICHNNTIDCNRDQQQFAATTEVDVNKIENVKGCLLFVIHKSYFSDDNKPMIGCPMKKSFRVQCDGHCNNDLVQRAITGNSISNNEVSQLYQFWLFFLFMALSWAGMAVVVSVGDAICFGLLGSQHNLYGNQRLWGSVGWGVVSIFSGFLVDAFSKDEVIKDYSVLFYIMIVLIALDMLVSSRLQYTQTKRSSNIVKDIGVLFLSLPIVVFFIWCIIVGLCTALIWNFLFWHLEELADAKDSCDHKSQNWIKTLQGLAMAVQCFGGELPFFFLSGWILKKIGHIHSMSLVLLGFGVRFLLYSILTNPWYVLPIELLNGVTFGIFYSTMASYASIAAPPGTEATLQGLVGAIFEGVGVSLGSFVGGILMEKIGGSATFRLYGTIALVFCFVHVVVQKLMEKYWTRTENPTRAIYTTPIDALTMLNDDDYLILAK